MTAIASRDRMNHCDAASLHHLKVLQGAFIRCEDYALCEESLLCILTHFEEGDAPVDQLDGHVCFLRRFLPSRVTIQLGA